MCVEEAREILGLREGFTLQELKRAYKAASLRLHPDMGGTDALFERLAKAYSMLKGVSIKGFLPDERTVEGTLVADLGQGYPLFVSAVECRTCGGKGWNGFSSKEDVEVDCHHCRGEGTHWYECKFCGGTGRYTHPKTHNKIGICYSCGGTGRFYPKPAEGAAFKIVTVKDKQRRAPICFFCHGTGIATVERFRENALKVTCSACKGVGEVKIYNPVLPRGFIESSSR